MAVRGRWGEYDGLEVQVWLKRWGVVDQVATAYSPKSNGAAERLNRTSLDIARTMFLHLWSPRIKL